MQIHAMFSPFNFGNQLQCIPALQNHRCVQYPSLGNGLKVANANNQGSRSFASVVGYPSSFEKIQFSNHFMKTKNIPTKATQAYSQYQIMMGNKEFQDFHQMPSLPPQDSSPTYNQQPDKSAPSTKPFHCHLENVIGHTSFLNPKNIVSSIIRTCQKSSTSPTRNESISNNKPNWKQQNHQIRKKSSVESKSYHHHHYAVPKNYHKKDRSNLEREIHYDVCDPNTIILNTNVTNNNNERSDLQEKTKSGAASKKTTENEENPPFLIYSLEEFPAIVSTIKPLKLSGKKKSRRLRTNKKFIDAIDKDFVIISTDASFSTPQLELPKQSIREKLIKSPKKLLMKPSLKPILKLSRARRRSVSECSDDWIEFTNDSTTKTDKSFDFNYNGSDSDESEGSDGETSDDEYLDDDCDESEDEINFEPIESGLEDKKVRFMMKPTVHVMRVWDYAYRACRKGDVWQQVGRDTERFKKRIQDYEEKISPILEKKHREKVFNDRFQKNESFSDFR